MSITSAPTYDPATNTIVRWRPRWRLRYWTVLLEEWCVRPLDRSASTTGQVIDVTVHRWLWIRFLLLLLGSRNESVRVFAGSRWRKMRVRYNYPYVSP